MRYPICGDLLGGKNAIRRSRSLEKASHSLLDRP